jgi:dihydroflavonol-4-reductase
MDRGGTGRRYILAGNNMTYYDTWCLFADVSGGRRPLGRVGPVLAYLAGHAGDLMTKLTGREPDVNSAGVRMGSLHHYYSSARAEQELGYRTRSARESAECAWQWFTQHGYV